MPILTRNETQRPGVHCVREVLVGIPFERRLEVERFYTRLLHLRPWPEVCQLPGGWGAGDARNGVYFQYRHDPEIEPMRRRFAISVKSLDRVEQALKNADWPYDRKRGFGLGDERILLLDPVGHRVEVRQSQPL